MQTPVVRSTPWRGYALLARLLYPRRYLGKVFLLTFLGIHVPLLALTGYLLLTLGLASEMARMVFLVALMATLVGSVATLLGLWLLLSPIAAASSALRAYQAAGHLPALPWVEQASKQVKGSLGWSQYQVRSDRAMRRHWALVQCAFAFCWWAETHSPSPQATGQDDGSGSACQRGGKMPGANLTWPRPWRCWTVALRRVRAWREPAWFLWRCWHAWSDQPPPPPLQALLDSLHHGPPLPLYDSS